MKRLPIIALALACGFAGCKKDSNNAAPAASKTDMLTAKNWRLTAASTVVASGGQTVTNDDYATADACEKDDFLKFNTNKSLTYDEGAVRCNSTHPQTTTGAWDLTSSDSKLLLQETSSSSSAELYDIAELSASTLKLKQTETLNGATYVINLTFTAF